MVNIDFDSSKSAAISRLSEIYGDDIPEEILFKEMYDDAAGMFPIYGYISEMVLKVSGTDIEFAWSYFDDFHDLHDRLGKNDETIDYRDNETLMNIALIQADMGLPETLCKDKFYKKIVDIFESNIEIAQIQIEAHSINKAKRGRPKIDKKQRIFMVDELLKKGFSKNKAYKKVGEELNKSPDTIRRVYERFKRY